MRHGPFQSLSYPKAVVAIAMFCAVLLAASPAWAQFCQYAEEKYTECPQNDGIICFIDYFECADYGQDVCYPYTQLYGCPDCDPNFYVWASIVNGTCGGAPQASTVLPGRLRAIVFLEDYSGQWFGALTVLPLTTNEARRACGGAGPGAAARTPSGSMAGVR